MASTAVSDYSADNFRYYRRYFLDDRESRSLRPNTADDDDEKEKEKEKEKEPKEKLPRIVLKTNLGRELDTFTTLQEAIYRAKRNVNESMQAVRPEEWRLPKAPLPSRPDFSRAVPTLSEIRKRKMQIKQKQMAKSTPSYPHDIDVNDVGFVAESLQHLPEVPSLSFLRQEFLAEPKKYFPFVQSMLMFEKYLSQTDKRDSIYNFPGFCTGCRRMGLCYGCERSSEPHYHMDQPFKTGGGFTFYKRDRPEHELKHKHPSNWRYTFPELARKSHEFEAWKDKEMRRSSQGSVNYDELKKTGFLPSIVPDAQLGSKLGENAYMAGETTAIGGNIKDNFSEDEGILVDKITAEEEELLGIKHSKPSSPSTRISGLDGDDEMYSAPGTGSDARGDVTYAKGRKRVSIVEDMTQLGGKSSGSHGDGTYTDQSTDYDDDEERSSRSKNRKSRRKRRLGNNREGQGQTDDDEEEDGSSRSNSKSAFSGTSSERRRLYKAPAPFKIKKRNRRKIQSLSPFSTNRSYDLHTGEGFKVKKSGKSPTQFKEFKKHDGEWKEPKKFEVKQSDKKATGFWSPPPQKVKEKPKVVKRREIPVKHEHPPSPDSGLESERMAAMERLKKKMEKEVEGTDKDTTQREILINNEELPKYTDQFTPSEIETAHKQNGNNQEIMDLEIDKELSPFIVVKTNSGAISPIIYEPSNNKAIADLEIKRELPPFTVKASSGVISPIIYESGPTSHDIQETVDLEIKKELSPFTLKASSGAISPIIYEPTPQSLLWQQSGSKIDDTNLIGSKENQRSKVKGKLTSGHRLKVKGEELPTQSIENVYWYSEDRTRNQSEKMELQKMSNKIEVNSEEQTAIRRPKVKVHNGVKTSNEIKGQNFKKQPEKLLVSEDAESEIDSHKLSRPKLKVRNGVKSSNKVKGSKRIRGHKFKEQSEKLLSEDESEVDFDKLPSIRETLEKILPKKIFVDLNLDAFERSSQYSDKVSCDGNSNEQENVHAIQIVQKANQPHSTLERPSSETYHSQNLKMSTIGMRRTSSCPDIDQTAILELSKLNLKKENKDRNKLSDVYHPVLPAFPARFKPKKMKSKNPRRVGQSEPQRDETSATNMMEHDIQLSPQLLDSQEQEDRSESQNSLSVLQIPFVKGKSESPIQINQSYDHQFKSPDQTDQSVGQSFKSCDSFNQSENCSNQMLESVIQTKEIEKKIAREEKADVEIVVPAIVEIKEVSTPAADIAPEPTAVSMETEQERKDTPSNRKPSSPEPQKIISTPVKTPAPVVEKIKKEKPKKTRKEKVKDEPKPPPTPSPPMVERTMSPESSLPPISNDGDMEVAMATPTPEPTKELPELPAFDIPALPEIKDEKKKVEKESVETSLKSGASLIAFSSVHSPTLSVAGSTVPKEARVDDRRTQLIQSVPKMKEVKEPLPKKKFAPKITKKSMPKRVRSRESAKAPVTPEELRMMVDPLDFLAKYCIINKDRLPYYERVYQNIVSNQTPKYERIHDSAASISGSASLPVLADHEMNMLHDMTVINRAQKPTRIGLSVPEQYLEKICYTLDLLEQKQNKMSLDLHNLEGEKLKKLAEKGKELNPAIGRPDFQAKAKKAKKKKKKKGKGKDDKADTDDEAPPEKLTLDDMTDRIIVDRMDDKTINSLCKHEPDIHQLDLEMDRIAQKVSDIDERIEQLENEKNLLGIYCMEYFFRDQTGNKKPMEFRRQQSTLFNKLHPDPDVEMNMEELEGALQVINHDLLTEKEFEYLYNILNLPGRLKINFQLFAVIAALSEKVTLLDPVIRKLLNKVDYGALDVKMDRSKELFELLDDGTITPSGNAPADSLAVELRAGGLSQELTNYVLSKFNRNGKGFIDFLDFVTYVPLFIEIHEKIISDPFNVQVIA